MVLNRQRRIPVALEPLEKFLARLKATLDLSRDVAVCLVSEVAIARMNVTYRKKKGPTDVLSFPSSGRAARRKLSRPSVNSLSKRSDPLKKSDALYLGDIAIAPETARRNSRRLHRPLPLELRILILHGVLHLLGYDHETDRGEMNRLERRLRRRLALE
ncbi:MAG TPA: rRNA maturation RNase YbeY [Candidatus Dormibacteraeota bacterium]|nr:rRNA maturation RNase YbeY [Candidatus Dormibacteraeota bacterium]